MSEHLERMQFIIIALFDIANKLQMIGDRHLSKDGLTTKQWFLILMMELSPSPPSLGEMAALIGTSRQNVKQIALKLENKGFIRLEKDLVDRRIQRLRLAEKNRKYWKKRDAVDDRFIRRLFAGFSSRHFNSLHAGIKAFHRHIRAPQSSLTDFKSQFKLHPDLEISGRRDKAST